MHCRTDCGIRPELLEFDDQQKIIKEDRQCPNCQSCLITNPVRKRISPVYLLVYFCSRISSANSTSNWKWRRTKSTLGKWSIRCETHSITENSAQRTTISKSCLSRFFARNRSFRKIQSTRWTTRHKVELRSPKSAHINEFLARSKLLPMLPDNSKQVPTVTHF